MSTTITEIPAGTYGLDPVHSSIGFGVKYNGLATFRSSFEKYDAAYADGVLTGSADVTSITIDEPNFKGHLLTEDFFNAEVTPTVTFRSTDITVNEDGTGEVAGELTIRGVTKPVVAKGNIAAGADPYGNDRIAFELSTTVDRREFGLNWQNALPNGNDAARLGRHPHRRPAARQAGVRTTCPRSASSASPEASEAGPTTRPCSGRRRSRCRPGSSWRSTTASGTCPTTTPTSMSRAASPIEAAARLREAIAEADGILISTPEFNGSIPGALKNALDWASRPFPDNSLRGKPVAVVGASTGLFGAVWAQAETKKVLGIIGADVLEGELPVGQASGAFGDDGHLIEPDLRNALEELLGVLAARVGARESQAV